MGTCRDCSYWHLEVAVARSMCNHPKNATYVEVPKCNICNAYYVAKGVRCKCVKPQIIGGVLRIHRTAEGHETCEHWTDVPFLPDLTTVPKESKACIIIGKGPTQHFYKDFAAHHEKAEVWTLNETRLPGATAHFEIHDPRKVDCDDLSIHLWTAENYPIDEVYQPNQWKAEKRLLSCIDYMLALAGLPRFGFEYVYLPGCDFWGGEIEAGQAVSAAHYIGYLQGRGIRCWWSPLSGMLEEYYYK